MKKLIILIYLVMIKLVGFSQLAINLFISNTPPGTITDWNNRRDVFSFMVINQSGAVVDAIIKAELRTASGEPVASVNLAQARTYSFSAPSTFLQASEVIALQYMPFNGKFRTILNRTGKLPADNYQLCVQLVSPVDYRPLSPEVCRSFTIASISLPIPMLPADGSSLEAQKSQSAIIFRWTALSPSQSQPVIYHIQVFEILNHQTPMQAFRANKPLLDQEVTGATQYIWNPQMDLTVSCCDGEDLKKDSTTKDVKIEFTRRFIWTIQSLDPQHRPFNDGNVNGDGRSEPAVFYIRRS